MWEKTQQRAARSAMIQTDLIDLLRPCVWLAHAESHLTLRCAALLCALMPQSPAQCAHSTQRTRTVNRDLSTFNKDNERCNC